MRGLKLIDKNRNGKRYGRRKERRIKEVKPQEDGTESS